MTIDDRRWLIEVVGFSTAEHLTYKLERYELAGISDVALCVDVERSTELLEDPRVVPFKKQVDARALVGRLSNPAVPS